MTILASIDPKTSTVRRYSGRTLTHGFVFDVPITAERIKDIINCPDAVGEPEEKEVA